MKIRKPLAAVAVASLCVTGIGATAGTAAATDAPAGVTEYVPFSKIKKATTPEHETDVYNV